MSEHFLERQHIELRKDVDLVLISQISKKKIEWDKERQLLLQKIDHLEIQLGDFENRERRLVSTQAQLMATIGNPKDDKMQQQTQQMLQDLSSQVQIIRQATMNEQCTSIIGDDRKSEIPKIPSPRITASQAEERLSDGYHSNTQLGTNKFRSVHDQHLSSAHSYLDARKGTSLDVPNHHIPGGYKRIQAQNHSGKDAQTLSFGHELIPQRPGSKVSLNRGHPSEQGLRVSQENSRKNGDQEHGEGQKHQYKQSNYDSQGTIAVRISQSNKKAGYTSSMPKFDCSNSGMHSHSQEHIRTTNPNPGFHLMKQDLESSNTSDGPDELLEASDTRTNQENSRHVKDRNYHLNQHQGSAVTLHYSTKYRDALGNYPDQEFQNHPEMATSTPKGRPRQERAFLPQGHPQEASAKLSRADWTERHEPGQSQVNGSRYYVKSGNPSSSTKRLTASAHPSHMDSVALGTHSYHNRPAPFHVQSHQLTSTEASHIKRLGHSPADPYSRDSHHHTPQPALRSDGRRANPHPNHGYSGHQGQHSGLVDRTGSSNQRTGQHNNPFKDYSPDLADPVSNSVGEKTLPPGMSAPHGHRYCESACSHWVEEPPAELDDRSPKTVDKYSHCGHTVQRNNPTSEKGYLKPERAAHSYMDLTDQGYKRNTSSQGSRVHNPQYQKKPSEQMLYVPYQVGGQDPYAGLRSSVENPEHFMSRGPYLASCSHLSSVNQGGAGLARPRGTHNSSCYSQNSAAFVSSKSKKLKKSALLNSKMSETSSGLTRKDVLEILKLHKSLQTKINSLEGKKVSHKKV